ncbi:MAG: hypothetical protein PHC62_07300 [Candidatus Izemoplasmatales bacterium]|nr:hypothetical protein [Candidatus Izemoplasmatales bacterium]
MKILISFIWLILNVIYSFAMVYFTIPKGPIDLVIMEIKAEYPILGSIIGIILIVLTIYFFIKKVINRR